MRYFIKLLKHFRQNGKNSDSTGKRKTERWRSIFPGGLEKYIFLKLEGFPRIFLKVLFCLTENRVLKNESCGELIYPDQTRPEIPETHQEPWMKILWEKPILLNYVSFVDFILRIFVFHGNPLDSEGWVTSVFGLSRFSDFLKKVSSYVRDFLFFQGKTKTSKICYIKYSHF